MRRITIMVCALLTVAALAGCDPAWHEQVMLNSGGAGTSTCTITVPAGRPSGWIQERAQTATTSFAILGTVEWTAVYGSLPHNPANPTLWNNSTSTGWKTVSGVYATEQYKMSVIGTVGTAGSAVGLDSRVVDGSGVTVIGTDSTCVLIG